MTSRFSMAYFNFIFDVVICVEFCIDSITMLVYHFSILLLVSAEIKAKTDA